MRSVWSVITAAAIVAGFSVGSTSALALTPDSGPIEGGTVVTGEVSEGLKFTQISVSSLHTLAIGSDGHAYAWGFNSDGQLGNGTIGTQMKWPVRVQEPEGVTFTEVAAGNRLSVALGSNGKVYTWGINSVGSLGNGTAGDGTRSSVPGVASTPDGMKFTAITVSSQTPYALSADGSIYAWGYDGFGALGQGTQFKNSSVPLRVKTPEEMKFTAVVGSGSTGGFATAEDGSTWAWGYNSGGILGTGSSTDEPTPKPVAAPEGVQFAKIYAGNANTFALATDGRLYAWGFNNQGQFGNGNTTSSPVPVQVTTPSGPVFAEIFPAQYGTGAVTLALDAEGKAWAWGYNDRYGLGNGNRVTSYGVPLPVTMPEGVDFTQLINGGDRSFAIGSDGNTYVWGVDQCGETGAGKPAPCDSANFWGIPVPASITSPQVTGVKFGDVAGTDLVAKGSVWSATSPANTCGPVDVTVAYKQFGEDLTKVEENGFMYGAIPVVTTSPVSKNLAEGGGKVSLTAAATGSPAPAVQWQKSSDGKTWSNIAGATSGTFEATVTATTQYRALFTNCANTQPVPSAAAVITVAPTIDKPGTPKPPAVCAAPRKTPVFADTPLKHKFYKEIDWMECMKYSTGWRQPAGKPLYKPQDNLQRQAMAAFIYRMEAPKNFVAPKESPFADVKPTDSFYKEMAWMFQKGYSTGWAEPSGKPTYRPYEPLSREAMAAFIYRLEASKDATAKAYKAPKVSPMADMKPGMKFYKEISWMYSEKLSTGNKVGVTKEYWPKADLSRQAMAAFIYRLVTDYRVKK